MQSGDLKAAKGFSGQALSCEPTDVPSLTLHAQILQALGETDGAIAVLDKARENAEDEVPILIQRAALAADSKGLDALVRLSQRYPERSEVFAALSKSLADSGNVNDAIQAAQRAVKKASKSTSTDLLAEIHLHLGKLLSASGNLDQSLHHLEQAAKLAPYSAASHLERGRVFLARRQQRHAIQAFQQAAALAPKDAAPHLEIGLALKEAKDFDGSEAELRRAAHLSPKDRHIQRQLAGVIALNIVHHPAEAGVTQ
jgi:tetratricopeptide (TPR) repeat protein